ncbi:hypothetical protein ABZ345_16430 [Lentzea sp. NPDC005914]|uniref:hypothetical protein n=1 Tax=Lentzea sp. NPDC005914 TaxID=3154572 RepID=UPI0033F294AB
MNGFDYERWITSMNGLADRLVAGFEEKFGYPPGENKVTPATEPVPDGVDDLPAPLAEFYRHVAEVSLPDLQNGYFISNARHTVGGRDGRQIVRVEGALTSDLVTFGADGGGTHFALGLPDGAPVYQLPPGAVDRRGVYDDWDSRVRVVAASLPEFLTALHDFFASEISGR